MTKKIKNNLPHQKVLKKGYYFGLPINTKNSNPSYWTIINKAYREITLLMARYSRVVLVRVDLHPPATTKIPNIDLTRFCKSIRRKLEKEYDTKVAYQWAKEFGREDYNTGIHWHLWLAVKNDKDTQPHTQSYQIFSKIITTWEEYSGGENNRNHMSGWFYLKRDELSVDKRKEQQMLIAEGGDGILINMEKIKNRKNNTYIALGGKIDECFYAISYLAKVYSKVKRDSTKGKRMTACSNLNTNDNRKNRKLEIEKRLEEIHYELEQPPLQPKELKTRNTILDEYNVLQDL
jgi:hypothetical protein